MPNVISPVVNAAISPTPLSVASNNIPGSRNNRALIPTDYPIAKKQCLNQSKTRTASPSKRGTTSGLPCEAADTKATSKKSSQPKSVLRKQA